MLKTRLARLWLCQKTGRIRSFTNSIPCARVSTRHQRYEQSSTLEGLVHEASQASRGSSDNYRSLSKLICTVGPSTHSPSEIQNLVDIGMSVMRINCSKSTIEETKERVEWLRACQGLQGGDIQPTPTRPLNLRSIMFDTMNEKHLQWAIDMGVDFVSFNATHVGKVRSDLYRMIEPIKPLSSIPKLIAKIQSADALTNFDDILHVSDGILIERKLLAQDIPLGVVRAQKKIVQKCNSAGKPVIIASQMLDTMIDHPTPTRAEISDIVNAVYDGADCVMLSRESSEGSYPIESCRTLARIARQADKTKYNFYNKTTDNSGDRGSSGSSGSSGSHGGNDSSVKGGKGAVNDVHKEEDFFNQGVWPAMTKAAVQQAKYGDVDLIVVITSSGKTAEMLSAENGPVPIMAFVGDAKVGRRLSMHRGVHPVYGPMKHTPPIKKKFETNMGLQKNKEKMDMVQHEFLMVRPKEAVIRAKELNMVQTGDTVLIVMSEPSSNVLGRTITTRTARVK